MAPEKQSIDVAAYIWPSYTGDEPRTRMFWPEGDGEWETVRHARPKYEGHIWPRRPLWGYCNEADPYVMEMQINAAADHGVNVFIYDWYWYDGRPFLEQCLSNGYLKARNNDRVKFYVMWANHNVTHLWDRRIAHIKDNIIWRAGLDRREFEVIAHRIIERYFSHPSYYCIDGKPVLMVFDLNVLVEGFGGVEETRAALDWFQKEVIRAGFPGVHMQLASRRGRDDQGVAKVEGGYDGNDTLAHMGFHSLTHYQTANYTNVDREYAEIVDDMPRAWARMEAMYDLPYYAHVSVGWDTNPRFQPFIPNVVKNNTPDQVQRALELAHDYVLAHPKQAPLITLNSWNEWTECSYLQPDDLYGYGYLEAVKAVFKGK